VWRRKLRVNHAVIKAGLFIWQKSIRRPWCRGKAAELRPMDNSTQRSPDTKRRLMDRLDAAAAAAKAPSAWIRIVIPAKAGIQGN
jgi:hypothetical protein